MNFENLQNFVNNYLEKTEPNVFWSKEASHPQIIKTENSGRSEINLTNVINDKNFIGRLSLNDFDIKINKPGVSVKLAEGEYVATDEDFNATVKGLHQYLERNADEDGVYRYGNFVTEFLVCVNNKGDDYIISPLYLSKINKQVGSENYINPEILTFLKNIVKFFAEKHRNFLNMTFEQQRNFVYLYKLTSPYTQQSKFATSAGMQTESAHMDSCNSQATDTQLIGDFYCELSSIVYTDINNECSTPEHYYASAAFFYGPEIPMPVAGDSDLKIGRVSDAGSIHSRLLIN